MFEQFSGQQALPTLWFLVIGVLWIGYLVLDSFDLGVGMLMSRVFARDEAERRTLLNTIGPVWDGNEVWLVTAGAATFAAFPYWYASLFSALYIPLTLLLLCLIGRAVSIEYRGKGTGPGWTRTWTTLLALCSCGIAFLIGAALALTTTGLPLDAHGDRVGGPFVWVTPAAVLGGIGMVCFSVVHGLAFVALKTDGEIRHRARKLLVRLMPVAVLPLAGWVLLLQGTSGNPLSWILTVLAVLAAVLGWVLARSGAEGKAFAGLACYVGLGALAIFLAAFPEVLPTTLNSGKDLTVASASSSPYTLTVMTWVAGFGLPILLLYQGWTYWVFRQRLRTEHIPAAHDVADLAQLPTR